MNHPPDADGLYVADAIRTGLRMYSDAEQKQDVLCHLLYKLAQSTHSEYALVVERVLCKESKNEEYFLHIVNKQLPEGVGKLLSEINVQSVAPYRLESLATAESSSTPTSPSTPSPEHHKGKRGGRKWGKTFRSNWKRPPHSSSSLPLIDVEGVSPTFRIYQITRADLQAAWFESLMSPTGHLTTHHQRTTPRTSTRSPVKSSHRSYGRAAAKKLRRTSGSYSLVADCLSGVERSTGREVIYHGTDATHTTAVTNNHSHSQQGSITHQEHMAAIDEALPHPVHTTNNDKNSNTGEYQYNYSENYMGTRLILSKCEGDGIVAVAGKYAHYTPKDERIFLEFVNTIQLGMQVYYYQLNHQSVQQQERLFNEVVKSMALPLVIFDYRNSSEAMSSIVDPTRMVCTYVNDAFTQLTGYKLHGAPDQQYYDPQHNVFAHFLTEPTIFGCIQRAMSTPDQLTTPRWNIHNIQNEHLASKNMPNSARTSHTLNGSPRVHRKRSLGECTCSEKRCVEDLEYGDEIIPHSHYEVYVYRVNGTRVGMVLRDISEKLQHLKLIEQASRAKTEFLANINHEFRTPLNGIDGNLQLLTKTLPLTEKQEDLIHRMRISSTALMSILQEVLDYAKLEQQKIELKKGPFSVRHCIQATFDVLSGPANRKGLALTYDMDLEVPAVILGDSFRLQQILVNLVSNAIKFTTAGSVSISVRPEKARSRSLSRSGSDGRDSGEAESSTDIVNVNNNNSPQETMLRFDIRDTGDGIGPEDQERLFLPWVQLEPVIARHQRGTGLGLAICRQLCALMKGRIWLDKSVCEVGSTFSFVIPLCTPKVEYTVFKATEVQVLHGKSILIVDDNAENRKMLMRIAIQWKMRPTTCATGEEAIDYLRAGFEFDVALLDIFMPNMDGNQLAEWIYEHQPELPIFALSSAGEVGVEISQRFTRTLFKPIRFEKLFDVLLNLFQNAAQDKYTSGGSRTKGSGGGVINHVKGGNKLAILVVEDVKANQEVLVDMLNMLGFNQVDVCENGQEMLDTVAHTSYHIILLDLLMPVMNGLEAARIFRETHALGTLPYIVAVTATDMLSSKEADYRRAGMDAFISKPIKMKELEALLDVVVEQVRITEGWK